LRIAGGGGAGQCAGELYADLLQCVRRARMFGCRRQGVHRRLHFLIVVLKVGAGGELLVGGVNRLLLIPRGSRRRASGQLAQMLGVHVGVGHRIGDHRVGQLALPGLVRRRALGGLLGHGLADLIGESRRAALTDALNQVVYGMYCAVVLMRGTDRVDRVGEVGDRLRHRGVAGQFAGCADQRLHLRG